MTYLIDTNIFLRVLVKENEVSFGECKRVLELIKNGQLQAVVPSLVICEIVWTLSSLYKFPKQRVVEAVRSLMYLNGLKVIFDYDQLLALELFEIHNTKYIDCCLAAVPGVQSKEWTVLSYDLDFDKLKVGRQAPKEVIESSKFTS